MLNPHSRQNQALTPAPKGTGLSGANAPQARVKTLNNPLSRKPSLKQTAPTPNYRVPAR